MAVEGFFTFREYMQRLDGALTATMEDYMEMVYRLCQKSGYTRINELSAALNVQPPAASKMVQKLSEIGLLDYEKYGLIVMGKTGQEVGAALLLRHNTVEKLLRTLGIREEDILPETERVEHTLLESTIAQIAMFLDFWEGNPDLFWRYHAHCRQLAEIAALEDEKQPLVDSSSAPESANAAKHSTQDAQVPPEENA